jgi:hypothetical protein
MTKKNKHEMGGRCKRSPRKKQVVGVSFDPLVIAAIDQLPQIISGEWSRSYLLNQLAANWLSLPADYEWSDLDIVKGGGIVE